MKTAVAAPPKSVYAIVYRAFAFKKPDPLTADKTAFVDSADPEKWFQVQPSEHPQEIPAWVAETEAYKTAVTANYIIEVAPKADTPFMKPATINRTVDITERKQIPPLAAETRRIETYQRRTGLGVVV